MDGKTITIFFNDTPNTVSIRKGKKISQDNLFLKIETENGTILSIPIIKIVRVEE